MKRTIIFLAVLLIVAYWAGAVETFYGELSDAQRYDLADAYQRVAVRFDELGEKERAERFRLMVEVIYPGFTAAERPEAPLVETEPPARTEQVQPRGPDPAGEAASVYYFNKLLRGVFNENASLTASAIGDVLYLPLFDDGLDRAAVAAELNWLFDKYEIDSVAPHSVFDVEAASAVPLDNGFWRLDVGISPEYANAIPEVTFWTEKIGFYFRKFPEGWRLAAIGPVS